MPEAVASLAELEQAEQIKAGEKFAALLDRLEAGEVVANAQTLKIVREAGKTAADVDAELARRRKIAGLREKVAGRGTLKERHQKLAEQLKARRDELEAVTAPLHQAIAEIQQAQQVLHRESIDVDAAHRELCRLVPPDARDGELRREAKRLMERVRDLEMMLRLTVDPRTRHAAIAEVDEELAALKQRLEGNGWLTQIGVQRRVGVLESKRAELAKFEHLEPRYAELEKCRARLAAIRVERESI